MMGTEEFGMGENYSGNSYDSMESMFMDLRQKSGSEHCNG